MRLTRAIIDGGTARRPDHWGAETRERGLRDDGHHGILIARDIGVVILDCDQVPLTERCLRSIAAGTIVPGTIVVVANTTDPSALQAACERSGASPIVLQPGRNLGCAGGRNLGLDYLRTRSDSQVFVLLDNDTVVPQEFFETVGRLALGSLEVAAPVIFDLAGHTVWSGGGYASADGAIRVSHELPAASPLPVDWAPGACLIVPRSAWQSVGHFDRGLDFLFEDIEWCHRLRKMGGTVRVHAPLRLYHEPHQSLGGRGSPQRMHLMARNGTVYLITILGARASATTRWVASQMRIALGEILTGGFRGGISRMTGLFCGLVEAARRTRSRALTADA